MWGSEMNIHSKLKLETSLTYLGKREKSFITWWNALTVIISWKKNICFSGQHTAQWPSVKYPLLLRITIYITCACSLVDIILNLIPSTLINKPLHCVVSGNVINLSESSKLRGPALTEVVNEPSQNKEAAWSCPPPGVLLKEHSREQTARHGRERRGRFS